MTFRRTIIVCKLSDETLDFSMSASWRSTALKNISSLHDPLMIREGVIVNLARFSDAIKQFFQTHPTMTRRLIVIAPAYAAYTSNEDRLITTFRISLAAIKAGTIVDGIYFDEHRTFNHLETITPKKNPWCLFIFLMALGCSYSITTRTNTIHHRYHQLNAIFQDLERKKMSIQTDTTRKKTTIKDLQDHHESHRDRVMYRQRQAILPLLMTTITTGSSILMHLERISCSLEFIDPEPFYKLSFTISGQSADLATIYQFIHHLETTLSLKINSNVIHLPDQALNFTLFY